MAVVAGSVTSQHYLAMNGGDSEILTTPISLKNEKDRSDSASLDGDGNVGSPADESMSGLPGKGSAQKSRKPNWTDHEIRALIEEYDRHRDIMRCRGQFKTVNGQVINNEKRNRIWERITDVVNRSQPEGMNMLGGVTVCTRTVKEVIKKWVNLVNKMKSDIAIQRSKPGSELCLTSRAVNILVNTNLPLDMDSLTADTKMAVNIKHERDPYDDDYVMGDYQVPTDYSYLLDQRDLVDVSQVTPTDLSSKAGPNRDVTSDMSSDSNHKTSSVSMETPSANSVASNVKNAIRKRKLNPKYYNNVTHLTNASVVYDVDNHVPEKRSKKSGKPQTERNVDDIRRFESDASFAAEHVIPERFQWQTSDVMPEGYDSLSETNRFNQELIELSRTKMNLDVDRMRVESEKLEIEKDKALIEKETATLQREKLQLEVQLLKQKLELGKLQLEREKARMLVKNEDVDDGS